MLWKSLLEAGKQVEEKFSNKTQSPDSTVFHQKHSLQELESIGLLINMSLNLSRNRTEKFLKKQ